MTHTPYRSESRKDYGTTTPGSLTLEQLKTGAFLRIADATEMMAKRHKELMDDAERHLKWYNQERERAGKAERSNAALRGQITKLKKIIQSLKNTTP